MVGVWEDPYGLKDFDVGNIIATVCIQAPPVPICGVGLGFYARLGDIQIEFLGQVSETIAFCGYVENLSLGSLAEFFYEANTGLLLNLFFYFFPLVVLLKFTPFFFS